MFKSLRYACLGLRATKHFFGVPKVAHPKMVVEKYGKWKASFEITYDQHQEPCGALMYGKKCRKLCFPISIVRGTEKKNNVPGSPGALLTSIQDRAHFWLLVEPTPLKNMIWSVGMMTFPTEWKVIKFHGSKAPTRFHRFLV